MKSSLIFDKQGQNLFKDIGKVGPFVLLQRLPGVLSRYFSWWQEQVQKWVASQSEITVWQTEDELGNYWWHAFDPVAKISVTRESEAEILAWLDFQSHQ